MLITKYKYLIVFISASIIFALLDITDIRTGYPFIADAPVSKLSGDNKLAFFDTLIKELENESSSINQSIVMAMDLMSGKESKEKNELVINDLGRKVFKQISKAGNGRIFGIYNNKVKMLNV